MLLKTTIDDVARTQIGNLTSHFQGTERDILKHLPNVDGFALVISGIRRCGKSTLLQQLLYSGFRDALYINFEDPRLFEFEMNDFSRLDQIIEEQNHNVLFFDELQVVAGWERYVRQKLEAGKKVVITGSNATMLSKELGTKLTGRHIKRELFPFSWNEFKVFNNAASDAEHLAEYLKVGGFPEYVRQQNDDILHQLFEDILARDIAVRYGVRDVKTLQRLALHLISNTGRLVTGNKIKTLFGVSSTTTIMEYFSHLEQTYLFSFIPKFSYSSRKQLINPRKVYAIDTGLINTTSKSFSDDFGPVFENLVFLHLRRHHEQIFYFKEKSECDFITIDKGIAKDVVQVCYELTPDNLDRELNGLFEALNFFSLKEGTIVTMNQSDQFERDGCIANVVPCHTYFDTYV
jgi:predicted AAA+ superfamily ATPase